ncbi:TPA: hypothetical protein ACH9JU_005526, partial [Escherichia coli]
CHGVSLVVTLCHDVRPPHIEDCGRINGLGLLPRFPALQVFEIINGLGQSANLHSGTIPTSNQRNFALCFKFSE